MTHVNNPFYMHLGPVLVIHAGIQRDGPLMDSRVRGSDGFGNFLQAYKYLMK